MYVNPILNQPARLVVRPIGRLCGRSEPIINMADTYYPAIALERYVIDSAPGRGVFQAPWFRASQPSPSVLPSSVKRRATC